MMMIRRLLACAMILVTALAACNPAQDALKSTHIAEKTATTSAKVTSTVQPTAIKTLDVEIAKLRGQKILFLHPWSDDTAAEIDLLVDEFNQSNEWGIHVMVKPAGSMGMLKQVFNDSIKNNDPAEIIAASTSFILNSDVKYENFVDFDQLVTSADYGLTEAEINDFIPAFWDVGVVEGKRISFPAQQTTSVIFYNTTWASELGFKEAPVTVSDFWKQVCAANKSKRTDSIESNDGLGGWIISTDALTMRSWLSAFDAIPETRIMGAYKTDAVIKAFEFLYQYNRDACSWTGSNPQPYDYFSERQALAYSGVMQDMMIQTRHFKVNGGTDAWKILPYPAMREQRLLSEDISYGVVKSDPVRELAAWLFIRWMNSPEHQARLLASSGTLPLGSNVLAYLGDFRAKYPAWNDVVSYLPMIETIPPQIDLDVQDMVLEDAAAFMYRSEFNVDNLPVLLQQVDDTIAELNKREP